MSEPARGFPDTEYHARLARAQTAMDQAGLTALLLTTEPEIRWFTGFLTRFWESPTRPWFLVVPATGAPIAVIPEIGAPLMARGWITDIRTWPAPDGGDDGVTLLADTLAGLGGGRIGLPMGAETHLRMPLRSWDRLRQLCAGLSFVDDGGLLRALRMVKSEAEIGKIAAACAVAARAFARLPEIARAGTPLSEVFRRFQIAALEEGADWVPYLAGAAGRGGYDDVISPATDAPLETGDVLMLDTGLVRDGYFCDFDRNVSLGPPDPSLAADHARLVASIAAGAEAARPGARAAEVFEALHAACGEAGAARLGHGLGLQLTEAPSLAPWDDTVLLPGMVLTLEPAVTTRAGRMLVHEEVIVVREAGADFLTDRASVEMPVAGAA